MEVIWLREIQDYVWQVQLAVIFQHLVLMNRQELKVFLVGKRGFLLRLLENPNLLEHERFTELLWAVFHLVEELEYREDLANLPKTDLAHLEGDVLRVYRLLLTEYLFYLNHLKDDYPYLFSLAMRLNPFNPNASPVVR